MVALCPLTAAAAETLSDLGRALFHDPNLSFNRTQACATCHDPAHAFIDPRTDAADGAVSRGADGRSVGTRNTPSLAYAAQVPRAVRQADGEWRGGLFLDGRATSLEVQAREPLTNPLEMALPDDTTVVARVAENADYVATLEAHFGADVMATTERAMSGIASALAAFQRSSPPFMMFDSRYDRFLRGEEALSDEEELGRRLFFSDLTNCMLCHLLEPNTVRRDEAFTNHRYHNIGVPANPRLDTPPDPGLAARPGLDLPAAAGKFRTPTLRNIAVTAPYMHNGVFRELATAIKFYNQYIVDNAEVGINPETNTPWGPPENEENIDVERLGRGQPIADQRVAALIAFLRTLTDRRFEHLLPAADGPRRPPCTNPAEEACDE